MFCASGPATGGAPVRQTLGDARAADYMKGRKTLEINPDHPIITALQSKVSDDAENAKARRHSFLLCASAPAQAADTRSPLAHIF